MPVVLYLDIPQSPTDLNITYLDYSMISVQWKPGFDGGWTQSFNISLDNSLWKETNESYFTFTRKIIEKGKWKSSNLLVLDLRHLTDYNITVRAYNKLGQSLADSFIRVRTKDVPIQQEGKDLISSIL
jgi:hypothetical protein